MSTSTSRSAGGRPDRTGRSGGHDDPRRARRPARRLGERRVGHRHEQRRAVEDRALAVALPEAVPARPAAGGEGVEAHRARPRPQQRGRRRRVEDRAGAVLAQAGDRGPAGGERPAEVGQRERPDLARPASLGDGDGRSRPLERAGERRVGDAPAVGGGEGDEQDVDGHFSSSCPAS
jgi:hypothetical protein